MYTLIIDTANKTLSVAILNDKKVLATHTQTHTLQHSVTLVPSIQQLMKDCGRQVKDLSQIVVSNGPGSYTGLRVGVTFAKTLAMTLNIPIVPISSLAILAQSAKPKDKDIIVPFFDARRRYIYAGMYQDKKILQPDCYSDFELFLTSIKLLNRRIRFVSPDIAIYQEDIEKIIGDLAICECVYPNASLVGNILEEYPSVDPHLLTPTYLKYAEAEEKWLANHQNEQLTTLVERQQFI